MRPTVPERRAEGKYLLSNARVLVDGEFIAADILLSEGRIARIFRGGRAAAAPVMPVAEAAETSGALRCDLAGKMILPGFIDIHTHGGSGVDFNHAGAADVRRVARFFSSRGVSSFLPTILSDSTETMLAQLDIITDPEVLADCPQILGVHLEGPFLDARYAGAQPARFLCACEPGLFGELQRAARGMIRLVTLSPELPGACDFIRALKASGVRASVGHSAASYEEAMAAIGAGAGCATHVMNAMKLLHMHDPAILTAVLESDIYAEMICDGFHLHPPIVRLLLKAKGRDRMIAVTDSIMAAGLPDGTYVLGANDVLVSGGDAKLACGGMRAGSTLTMIDAVRNIMRFTGMALGEVSALVSGNPARMLGVFGDTGSIAEGKRADLVVLDSELGVAITTSHGRVVHGSLG
jgi:N-acetylglucosamine-6-phosphate deacetylase